MSLPYQLQCCTLNVFSLYGNWVTGHNTMIAGAALIVGKLAHALPCAPSFSIGLGIWCQHFDVQGRQGSRGHTANPGSRMHSWGLIGWMILFIMIKDSLVCWSLQDILKLYEEAVPSLTSVGLNSQLFLKLQVLFSKLREVSTVLQGIIRWYFGYSLSCKFLSKYMLI